MKRIGLIGLVLLVVSLCGCKKVSENDHIAQLKSHPCFETPFSTGVVVEVGDSLPKTGMARAIVRTGTAGHEGLRAVLTHEKLAPGQQVELVRIQNESAEGVPENFLVVIQLAK